MNDMVHEQALDCKGLNCPLPILKTKKQIDAMPKKTEELLTAYEAWAKRVGAKPWDEVNVKKKKKK